MTYVLQVAAALTAAGALVAGAAALVSTRSPALALGVLLDLLLAAGLLRLVAVADWQGIIGAAAVVLIRKLVTLAYHRGSRVLADEPASAP